MKFDVICGNPPYNNSNDGKKGGARNDVLWPKFVSLSFELLKDGGYLCLIHPGLWRKPEHKLWPLLSSKQIEYLEMHPQHSNCGNADTGTKTFGVATSYDVYILCNVLCHAPTMVVDFNQTTSVSDLRTWPWFPGSNVETINKLIAKDGEETQPVLFDCVYHNQRKEVVSREKQGSFVYPVVNHTYNDGTIEYLYSCNNTLGHFGVPKVIIADNGHVVPINDWKGEFGMSENCFALPASTEEECKQICIALSSKKFSEVIWATKWSNYRTEYKMFKSFRKDFWKQFID